MAEMNWEKSRVGAAEKLAATKRAKFAFVGFGLITAMALMILIATVAGGRYFITVDEVVNRPELVGKTVKVTGAVIGSTIHFDSQTKTISFTIAHISDKFSDIETAGGLAKALHLAVNNTTATRIQVVVRNQPMPDLLQNEAQAILTGKMGADGLFYADDLQLKCPSKYESDVPQQVIG